VRTSAWIPQSSIPNPPLAGASGYLSVVDAVAQKLDNRLVLQGSTRVSRPIGFEEASPGADPASKIDVLAPFPNDRTMRYFTEKNPEQKLHELPLEQTR
jgi:hypothetical protein